MARSPLPFLLRCLAVFAACAAGYAGLFLAQIGAPAEGGYWVARVSALKRHLAARESQPKILLMGGSSGMFGLKTRMFQESFQRPAFNLCLHAGMELSVLVDQTLDVLGPGDVLLMHLENSYERSIQNATRDTVFMTGMMRTAMPEIFWRRDWAGKWKAFRSMPPLQVVQGALVRWSGPKLIRLHPDRDPRQSAVDYIAAWEREVKPWGSTRPEGFQDENYGSMWLYDPWGDIVRLPEITKERVPHEENYGWDKPVGLQPSDEAALDRLRTASRRLGVRVFLVPTPLLESRTWQAGDADFQRRMDDRRRLYARWGIEALGDPADFIYPRNAFYDTARHLRTSTSLEHTRKIIRLLEERLGPDGR